MVKSESVSNWVYGVVRAVERMGWRSAWFFHAGVALVVGTGVSLLLVWLDDVSWPVALLGALFAAVPAALAAGLALKLAHALAQTTRLHDPLGEDDDELDHVPTKRGFLRLADREWVRCRRYGDDGALLLIHTDHLERVQQTLGQRCADTVQRELTRCVYATLRQSDVLARFGSDQLAVFLPHTDPLGALDAAERIRQRVNAVVFPWETSQVALTVSVGVGHVHAGQTAFDSLRSEAQAALSLAQEAGHNCVRAAPIQPRLSDVVARQVTPR